MFSTKHKVKIWEKGLAGQLISYIDTVQGDSPSSLLIKPRYGQKVLKYKILSKIDKGSVYVVK